MMELLIRIQDIKTVGFFLLDAVANSIGEFSYKPEEGITFAAYFYRYDNVYRKEGMVWVREKRYISYFEN